MFDGPVLFHFRFFFFLILFSPNRQSESTLFINSSSRKNHQTGTNRRAHTNENKSPVFDTFCVCLHLAPVSVSLTHVFFFFAYFRTTWASMTLFCMWRVKNEVKKIIVLIECNLKLVVVGTVFRLLSCVFKSRCSLCLYNTGLTIFFST